MAGAKNHDYHILPPSFWPLMGSMSALVMAFGAEAKHSSDGGLGFWHASVSKRASDVEPRCE